MSATTDKKRIGIFLFYDTKGKVHEYVSYLLKDIQHCLDDLVIVTNGYLREDGRTILKKFSTNLVERPNIGFDAAGWKEAIVDYCGIEKIREYDELVLFNDSFFGPFYSFHQIFDEMDARDTDFWGLSSHGAAPSAGNKCPYGNRPAYIQTYFMVFRRSVLQSNSFFNYWNNLKEFSTFSDLVEQHSCILTKYFEEQGFRWDVFSDTRDLESQDITKNMSYHMFDSYNMVVNKRLPIIKRKAFIVPKEIYLRYGIADSLFRTLSYIDRNTSYDIRLIWEYLLENYNLYDLKQSLNLNYVLDTHCSRNNIIKHPTAAIIHLFYDDLFDYSLSYIQQLPEEIDIYITTSSEEKKEILLDKTKRLGLRIQQIFVVNNRGRELSALLIACKGIPQKYEYLCFYHDKKSSQKEFLTVGSDFRQLLTENIIGTREYIYNVLDLFDSNPQLGLLTPPNVYHGTYFSSSLNYWTICYEETKNVLCRLNIDENIIQISKPPVSVGTSFWCRVDALKPLFDEIWDYSDFPREPMRGDGTFSHALERCLPYVAQSRFYYTGTVMTTECAATEIGNFRYMMNLTMSSLIGLPHISFRTFFDFYTSIKSRKFVQAIKEMTLEEYLNIEKPYSLYMRIKQICRSIIPTPIWDTMHEWKINLLNRKVG